MTTGPPGVRQEEADVPEAGQRACEDARDIELSLAEPDRFGVIFDRYYAEIHGYAARRLGRDAADDIAADTFLTAFRQRWRFDAGRGIVRAWLYGIATNYIGRYQRHEVRELRALGRTPAAVADESHADLVADRVTAGRCTASWPGRWRSCPAVTARCCCSSRWAGSATRRWPRPSASRTERSAPG